LKAFENLRNFFFFHVMPELFEREAFICLQPKLTTYNMHRKKQVAGYGLLGDDRTMTQMMTENTSMSQETGVLVPAPFTASARDYHHIAMAMDFLNTQWRNQPSLETIAEHVGLSQAHFHRLFVRWAGLSPKAFLHAVTLEHARKMLQRGQSVLDTSYDLGLSGPGRLHDLFIRFEAMTPGDYKVGGADLVISYGFHASPFGTALAMATKRGLAGLAFAEGDDDRALKAALADMMRRWPQAHYQEDPAQTAPYVAQAFNSDAWQPDRPLKVVLMGSEFDVSVWEELLKIPRGCAVTYGTLAGQLGKPKAARAVGSAVGRNPISFVVPCHRVLRKSGELGGYHWGLARKRAIIGWESNFDPKA
jgi:AraC family transcriptional regulator, regulatory protein of adaptative response / methylated-DNA-[protein]-cysteine methyltransferase